MEALPSPSSHVVWDDDSQAWTAYLPSEHASERALPDRIATKLSRAEIDGRLYWFVVPNAQLQPGDIHLAESALQSRVEIAKGAPKTNSQKRWIRSEKFAETLDKSVGDFTLQLDEMD